MTPDRPCPFCQLPPEAIWYRDEHVLGIWDAYPVAPGHALLVLRRHVASWFDASDDERSALMAATSVARQHIVERLGREPDGVNIGINTGAAAGQTVMHLHVHVIPRVRGDVTDPRGGVRHTLPGKGHYDTDAEPRR